MFQGKRVDLFHPGKVFLNLYHNYFLVRFQHRFDHRFDLLARTEQIPISNFSISDLKSTMTIIRNRHPELVSGSMVYRK